MRTLSHNQRIDPCGNGLAQRVARCTGTRAEGPTARPPVGRNSDAHQGPSFRAGNDVGSRGKGFSVDVGISHYADEDRLVTGESLGGIKTKRAREQRVVAQPRVKIERQVRAVHRHIIREQSMKALIHWAAQRLRSGPEQSVMDNEQIGPHVNRALYRTQ